MNNILGLSKMNEIINKQNGEFSISSFSKILSMPKWKLKRLLISKNYLIRPKKMKWFISFWVLLTMVISSPLSGSHKFLNFSSDFIVTYAVTSWTLNIYLFFIFLIWMKLFIQESWWKTIKLFRLTSDVTT